MFSNLRMLIDGQICVRITMFRGSSTNHHISLAYVI